MKNFLKKAEPYLLFCALSLGTGLLSALLTRGKTDIFEEIVPPLLAPPSWLFPIVWTVLYVLMGVSMAMVWRMKETGPEAAKDALAFFGMNLFVNFAWSILFFRFRAFWLSFFWLLLLLAVVIRMTLLFAKVNKTAARLQIPYILWIAFAGYLTLSIAILN